MILKVSWKLSLQHAGESLQTLHRLSFSKPLSTKRALYFILLPLNFWDSTHLTETTFWSLSSTSSYTLCLTQLFNSACLVSKISINTSSMFCHPLMLVFCHIFYIKPRTVFTFGFSCSAYNQSFILWVIIWIMI